MRTDLTLILLLSFLSRILAIKLDCEYAFGTPWQERWDLESGNISYSNATDLLKCYIWCKLNEFDFVDSFGELRLDNIKAVLVKGGPKLSDELDRALDKCSQIEGANDCDTALLMYVCLVDAGRNR
ncbi:hypothetical protein KR009_005725 [Drosophila setifemur]|nr:hypothetical protein KR009_005725 [Drosophila setifemur]